MRVKRKSVGLAAVLALLVLMVGSGVALAQDGISVPEPVGFVNDYAKQCSPERVSALENKLSSLKTDTTVEVAIATFNDCGQDPVGYRTQVFRTWGIGNPEKNNGLLIMVCMGPKRSLEQEVGYGLEGVLPDLLTKTAAEEQFVPAAKQGDICQGLSNLVDYYDPILRGEKEVQAAPPQNPGMDPALLCLIVIIVIVVLVLIVIALSQVGGSGGRRYSGGYYGGSSSSGSSGGSSDSGGFGGFSGGSSGGGGSSTSF